jgi:tyrosine phenol-lyase
MSRPTKRSWAEPYKIKAVEPLLMTSAAERREAIENAGYNTFLLPSRMVYIDLLTDSGTSAMSDRQWAGMMMGDEAYAGSQNFEHLEAVVKKVYGFKYVVPTHQGRGAENLLSKSLIKEGDFVPGNMYFTTTRLHQELAGGSFVDVIIDEAHDPDSLHPFKGNVDLNKVQALIDKVGADRVPYLCLAGTVNMAGGQPFSMQNLRELRALLSQHNIPIYLDATRLVENSYFIQQREEGYANKTLAAIMLEIGALTDGCTMSAKKDSLVNIGGFLATNDPVLYEKACDLVVVFEGLHTYGGLAGRDMEAMAIGIEESIQQSHMAARIGQVEYLGEHLLAEKIPIVQPIGGHAIFLNAKRFYEHLPQDAFPGQTLAAELYLESGIRSMERGLASAGRDPVTGQNHRPALELTRLTIPRRVYTQAHMDVTAEAVYATYDRRKEARGLKMIYEPKYLRFFRARFEPL